MAGGRFYEAGPLKAVAVNLFYGWGYNFYRLENQLRADDQLVRAKAGWLLGLAQAAIETAESRLRRERLPAPTRANPLPDPAAVRDAQDLERLAREIGGLVGRLHAQPVPENDRMTQRYRGEAETLVRLGECDARLIGQCELLRSLVEGRAGAALLADGSALEEGLEAIRATLTDRSGLLA